MTHTPTTNTPTRVEALDELRDLLNMHPETPVQDFEKTVGINHGPVAAILTRRLIAALTAPIEKIEGLDEALKQWAEPGMTCESLHDEDMLDKIYQAASLYAQGRTQSAPEGWKLVPIEPTSQMVSAAGTHIENPNPYMGIRNSYQAMLSAAPPAGN
jgi:hypothetical protein